MSAAPKYMATYPIFAFGTLKRVGTGYVYTAAEIPAIRAKLVERGQPLQLRWRNEECRRAAMADVSAGGARP